jgi:hypothetical protein
MAIFCGVVSGNVHIMKSPLLDRHRLREISRLVDITPAANRDVISQQLQGNNLKDWQ